MDFEATFPLRYWINLGQRADRRGEMEWRLHKAGVTAERFPAVDARHVKRTALARRGGQGSEIRGYGSAGRYALALTQRMAIRQAKQRGVEAVLLLEDDAVFHPNFRSLIEQLELPEDWGICYLGCGHVEMPEPVAPGIVRARHAIDTHAVAIRASWFDRVLQALDGHGKLRPEHPLASDRYLASLQGETPTYACLPNLVWQGESRSDLANPGAAPLYRRGGTVNWGRHGDYFESMYGNESRSPRLGLLFLTRGDVHHPRIWREFVEQVPDQVAVFSHPKHADAVVGGFLEGTAIKERFETSWGDVSLVSASLAMLREALNDESLTHFVLLSEHCVPVRPLKEILAHLGRSPFPRMKLTPLERASDEQRRRAAMLPEVPEGCWRFHSQWWLLDRVAAAWMARADYTGEFGRTAIPDESYFGTVLSLMGYPVDDRMVDRDVTWTEWEKGAGSPKSHREVDEATLSKIVESGAWFARKFPGAADLGGLELHRPAVEDFPI